MLSIFPGLLPYGPALAPLILRLALGGVLAYSGYRSPRPAVRYSLVVIGAGLIAGFLVQPLALLVLLLSAYRLYHKTSGQWLLLGASALALLFLGPGILAIDLPL